jgi:lysophospholipase L1-like esterase
MMIRSHERLLSNREVRTQSASGGAVKRNGIGPVFQMKSLTRTNGIALGLLAGVGVIATAFAGAKAGEKPRPAVGGVACMGDSITLGAKLHLREKFSYPAQLDVLLGNGYDLHNFGVSGATLLFDGDKPYIKTPQFKEAMDFHPNILLLILGANDTCGGQRGNWEKCPAHFEADARALLQRLRRPGRRVLVGLNTAIFPDTPGLSAQRRVDLEKRVSHLEQIRDWWREAARAEGVELVDLSDTLKPNKTLVIDGVHPTTARDSRIARKFYESIMTTNLPLSWPRGSGGKVQRLRTQPPAEGNPDVSATGNPTCVPAPKPRPRGLNPTPARGMVSRRTVIVTFDYIALPTNVE